MEERSVEGHSLSALQLALFVEGIVRLTVIHSCQLLLDLVDLGHVPLVEGEVQLELSIADTLEHSALQVLVAWVRMS